MSRYWSPVVQGLDPYVPGEQPRVDNLIKLNTNESPYGPSPKAIAAIRAAADDGLRLYPDPRGQGLCDALARRFGLKADQVFVGNSSDEVLAHVFHGLLKHERALWMPDITYSFYPVYCGLYGIAYQTIPLDEEYCIRPDDYLPREDARAGAIIFANPNAPTGRPLALAEVERIVVANPQCVVVVDEAYVDFGGESAVALVNQHPNLLVVQTFSKSRALAGLRVGYAIGHAGLIEGLERVKNCFNSYPLDRLALAGAIASVEDETYFRETCDKVIASREQLRLDLEELGFEVMPSATNFVFARHPAHDAATLARALRERAILVRHFSKPRINQFLRITIGTDEQCATLVAALREITA
ncbi:MAG: histidinol-phosphate transaminase [Pseudazoarcus pumilus]|nr:histidinol-phosphate transaminase [Pseudazoarcus pumilus]